MKKEIAVFCVFVILIIIMAGALIYGAQLGIDRRIELSEEHIDLLVKYDNLSAEYNKTSEELNETKQITIQLSNAYNNVYNELLEKYNNLSVEYDETSKELEGIKEWLREENIHIEGENVIINKTETAMMEVPYKFINKEDKAWTSLRTMMGFNENNEFFIKVSAFNLTSRIETETMELHRRRMFECDNDNIDFK